MDDEFWIYDPSILIRPDRIVEFYPTIDMSANERLNSICRFLLYAGILIGFMKKKAWPIAVSIISMVATSLIHEKEHTVLKNLGKSRVRINKFNENFDEDEENYMSIPTCRRQTVNNPFANPMPTDFDNKSGIRVEACKDQFVEVKEEVGREPYNRTIDRFYTIPGSSIPNPRSQLLDAYRKDKVCRAGDQDACSTVRYG